MGSWSYNYDAFSDLTYQKDAKTNVTNIAYDLLGRPTQRVEVGLTSNWRYDSAPHGVGLLASACTGSGCTTPSNSSYFRSYAYDTLSRPIQIGLTVGGNLYAYSTTYDANGHIATVRYPSQFLASYVYTSLGYLSQIKDTDTIYFTANARDAEMHLTSSTAGNNVLTTQQFDPKTGLLDWTKVGTSSNPTLLDTYTYNFDVMANLSSRQDAVEGYTEYFCYDDLNRLKSSGFTSPGNCPQSAKTLSYDSIGNITSKSDTGTYAYTGSGPHAVSAITGTVDGVVNPHYDYDANGNLTCVHTGSVCSGGTIARQIAYTSFDMASQIVDGSTTIGLTYDSEHNRITQTASGSPSITTTYLNDPTSGVMSERVATGTVPVWRDYILVDGKIIAQRQITPSTTPPLWGSSTWNSFTWTAGPPTISTLYFTLDHLGSNILITRDDGTVFERESYDAWGKRRLANGSDAMSCTIATGTTRGFTNQEMMDEICAINLNARIYDPVIGRFMSADSDVPDPFGPQTFNRYSYVDNGPLSYTDPTGHALGLGFDGPTPTSTLSSSSFLPIDWDFSNAFSSWANTWYVVEGQQGADTAANPGVTGSGFPQNGAGTSASGPSLSTAPNTQTSAPTQSVVGAIGTEGSVPGTFNDPGDAAQIENSNRPDNLNVETVVVTANRLPSGAIEANEGVLPLIPLVGAQLLRVLPQAARFLPDAALAPYAAFGAVVLTSSPAGEDCSDATALGCAGHITQATRHTPEQEAVVRDAKAARQKGKSGKPITDAEADDLLDRARSAGIPVDDHRSPENAAHWIGGRHIKIGPINHIPVQ